MNRTAISALLASILLLPLAANAASAAGPAGEGGAAPAPDHAKSPMGVRDVVEYRHPLTTFWSKPLMISPDGSRYALLLTRGDPARGGNWLEIVSGSLQSLAEAAHPTTLRLFTTAAHSNDDGRLPVTANNRPVWLSDNRHIVLLWSDGTQPTQVVTVDLVSGKIERLTHHATSVIAFGISGDGRNLVYSAYPPRRADPGKTARDGYVVEIDNAQYLLSDGPAEPLVRWHALETFVRSEPSSTRRVAPEAALATFVWPANFSPDGRFVVVEDRPTEREPPEWDEYKNPAIQATLRQTRADQARIGGSAESFGHARQAVVYDLRTAAMRPLLDAPNAPGTPPTVLWESDGRHVIVGPTFLPLANASEAGQIGRALAEVDVVTGTYREIVVPNNAGGYRPVRLQGDKLEVADGARQVRLRRTSSGWGTDPTSSPNEQPVATRALTVVLKEDMNTPPVLYAVDRVTKAETPLFKIDPHLDRFVLSRVEIVKWRDHGGKEWSGRLYYPVDYAKTTRYPLVVQTHGYAPAGEFSLLGNGDSWAGTAFAAQALASRGIMILQVENHGDGGPVYLDGYEAGVKQLVDLGLVDPKLVGLVGWSRTGYFVEYILTHSDYPYAAAIAADNVSESYGRLSLMSFPTRTWPSTACRMRPSAWPRKAPQSTGSTSG